MKPLTEGNMRRSVVYLIVGIAVVAAIIIYTQTRAPEPMPVAEQPATPAEAPAAMPEPAVEQPPAAAEATAPPAAEATVPPAVGERIAEMKENGQQVRAIKAFVDGAQDDAAGVREAAADMAASAQNLPALFPQGTARGELDPTVTRALPAIWEDWAGFEAAAQTLAERANAVAAAADAGDREAIATAFDSLGQACADCHTNFRGPAVQ